MFCLCFCITEVISSFKCLSGGSQVFALLMLFRCVILHTMWSGKILQLPLLSAISMCVCLWVWWSEQKRELCPVSFLVVGESPSVLDTVVISGYDVCCSVVFGILVGEFVFSLTWSDFLMPSAISCPLWSSVYECHKVECAFTSPVRIECGMFVMYCMQCYMSV